MSSIFFFFIPGYIIFIEYLPGASAFSGNCIKANVFPFYTLSLVCNLEEYDICLQLVLLHFYQGLIQLKLQILVLYRKKTLDTLEVFLTLHILVFYVTIHRYTNKLLRFSKRCITIHDDRLKKSPDGLDSVKYGVPKP